MDWFLYDRELHHERVWGKFQTFSPVCLKANWYFCSLLFASLCNPVISDLYSMYCVLTTAVQIKWLPFILHSYCKHYLAYLNDFDVTLINKGNAAS